MSNILDNDPVKKGKKEKAIYKSKFAEDIARQEADVNSGKVKKLSEKDKIVATAPQGLSDAQYKEYEKAKLNEGIHKMYSNKYDAKVNRAQAVNNTINLNSYEKYIGKGNVNLENLGGAGDMRADAQSLWEKTYLTAGNAVANVIPGLIKIEIYLGRLI